MDTKRMGAASNTFNSAKVLSRTFRCSAKARPDRIDPDQLNAPGGLSAHLDKAQKKGMHLHLGRQQLDVRGA